MSNSINKILCIVGPTATGKTALAVSLASRYPSALISADSRQVYRYMDIVTGKDHPTNINIAGVDLVDPEDECSVANWYDAISPLLSSELPIIVGGTGLYVKAVTNGIPTMHIPPNESLRSELNTLSLTELQNKLSAINPQKLQSFNNSDLNNPRRLIRAIEVSLASSSPAQHVVVKNSLLLGLTWSDDNSYKQLILSRVNKRIQEGAIQETEKLLKEYDRSLPAMSAIGYRSIIQFLDRQILLEEMIEQWVQDEFAYAKRQMTWFKKVPGIVWFDAHNPMTASRVAEKVASWYDDN